MSEREAELLGSQLYQRLDRLEDALVGRDYLVGDAFSIADLSVLPRVTMYPLVQLPIDRTRYPSLCRWMALVNERPSMRRSASVRPD